ncbi:MAG: acyl-CoA dehydratase activase-related protein [Ignavibacteriales bacterium]
MKATFPHMGNTHIAIRSLLNDLGHEVVSPPPCSKKTLEIGIRHSPEFVCLPLKLNLGNFVEALEQGADTIIMAGGWGPCRFGYYAQVERDILHELGYQFDMVVLEAPDAQIKSLVNEVHKIKGEASWKKVIGSVNFAWNKIKAVDEAEALMHYWMPRVANKRQVEGLYKKTLKQVDHSEDRRTLEEIRSQFQMEFASLPVDAEEEPLKIGLVGEIYTILEPFANYDIELHLGRLGAEVVRSLCLTQWVNDHLLGGVLRVGSCHDVIPYADPYLSHWVGGHGRETVAYAVKYAQEKIDGVIQIGPLTCMPEIVAQSILCKVQENEGIPIMSMYFDEHAGEAGIITRLEAFLDMIRWKKQIRGRS